MQYVDNFMENSIIQLQELCFYFNILLDKFGDNSLETGRILTGKFIDLFLIV